MMKKIWKKVSENVVMINPPIEKLNYFNDTKKFQDVC